VSTASYRSIAVDDAPDGDPSVWRRHGYVSARGTDYVVTSRPCVRTVKSLDLRAPLI
jgi:hypothetical protein